MRYLLSWILVITVVGCGDDETSNDGARPVTEFNGVPYGATCADDTDCGGEEGSCCTGGKCSAEGWCSPECTTDNDCPSGFFCISHSGTRCFSGCADDRDCPDGFICEDKDNRLTCRAN
jgi:Cys-rich repeat protein